MIWGRSKYLLAATSFLVLGDTIFGFLSDSRRSLSAKFSPIYLWSVFAINILISVIAAGRIFRASQIARPILGHRNLRHYHLVVAILLESSAVYSACLLFYLLFPSHSAFQVVSILITMRVVAIMPTLLIIKIGLDRMARDSDPSECERHAAVLGTIVIATNHENQDAPRSDVHEGSRYP